MNPGATTRPPASMTRRLGSSASPTTTIKPSRTPTSARLRGDPLPSITSPPRISRSNIGSPPSSSPSGLRPHGGFAAGRCLGARPLHVEAHPPDPVLVVEPEDDDLGRVAHAAVDLVMLDQLREGRLLAGHVHHPLDPQVVVVTQRRHHAAQERHVLGAVGDDVHEGTDALKIVDGEAPGEPVPVAPVVMAHEVLYDAHDALPPRG